MNVMVVITADWLTGSVCHSGHKQGIRESIYVGRGRANGGGWARATRSSGEA